VGVTPRRIDVHIEELVLHGFPPLDRYAVSEAVQRELATLLEASPPATLVSADALDAAWIDASPEETMLGVDVARQIGKGLG
jgi:hypothetical protein